MLDRTGDEVAWGYDEKTQGRTEVVGRKKVWVSPPPCREYWPFFVNESAYYETGVAFAVARLDARDVALAFSLNASSSPKSVGAPHL
jgi:hypothetical protein